MRAATRSSCARKLSSAKLSSKCRDRVNSARLFFGVHVRLVCAKLSLSGLAPLNSVIAQALISQSSNPEFTTLAANSSRVCSLHAARYESEHAKLAYAYSPVSKSIPYSASASP